MVSRDPSADTESPDRAGLQSRNLHMAAALTLMKLWRVAANPKRKSGVPGVMHLSAAGQTPFPPWLQSSVWHSLSWQQTIKITLIYLCMLPGITCEPKKCIFLEKKQTDITQAGMVTLSFWAKCNHLRVASCNWRVFVSYNMSNSLKRMSIERQDIDWWVSDSVIHHSNIVPLLTLDKFRRNDMTGLEKGCFWTFTFG